MYKNNVKRTTRISSNLACSIYFFFSFFYFTANLFSAMDKLCFLNMYDAKNHPSIAHAIPLTSCSVLNYVLYKQKHAVVMCASCIIYVYMCI